MWLVLRYDSPAKAVAPGVRLCLLGRDDSVANHVDNLPVVLRPEQNPTIPNLINPAITDVRYCRAQLVKLQQCDCRPHPIDQWIPVQIIPVRLIGQTKGRAQMHNVERRIIHRAGVIGDGCAEQLTGEFAFIGSTHTVADQKKPAVFGSLADSRIQRVLIGHALSNMREGQWTVGVNLHGLLRAVRIVPQLDSVRCEHRRVDGIMSKLKPIEPTQRDYIAVGYVDLFRFS